LATAIILLYCAAEEAWMSINSAPGDTAPVAVAGEAERTRLGLRH